MSEVKLVVMYVEPGLGFIDVVVELLGTVESSANPHCEIVKSNNIIGYGTTEVFEEHCDYVVFGSKEGGELNREEKSKAHKVALKELMEEHEDIYTNIIDGDIKYQIMWVRTIDAEENGVA
jgi:hypothetical protein